MKLLSSQSGDDYDDDTDDDDDDDGDDDGDNDDDVDENLYVRRAFLVIICDPTTNI